MTACSKICVEAEKSICFKKKFAKISKDINTKDSDELLANTIAKLLIENEQISAGEGDPLDVKYILTVS